MKKNLIRLSCLLLLAFASCKSCKKDVAPVDQLPPETQTGANTAGALIDGVAWMPRVTTGGKATTGGYVKTSVNGSRNAFLMTMYQRNTGEASKDLQVYALSVYAPGRYPLSFDTGIDWGQPNTKSYGLYSVYGKMLNDPDYNYITTSTKTGYVNFTVADTTNKLFAGTFEFEAIDNPSGKTIKVSGGRFDLNLNTLR